MCTAVTYQTKDHYFGRTLDYEYSYTETVTVTPRKFPFRFRIEHTVKEHYAMIGMAYVNRNFPLYYDATNEKGLSIAGLHFPQNAVYKQPEAGKKNVASFELIPWILGQCASVEEALPLLKQCNVTNLSFQAELPAAPLHWLVSDRNKSLTVEPGKEGVKIYENPVGILTNNPPFAMQLFSLKNYINLTAEVPENRFSEKLDLTPYSRGMGAMGLPGDLSSSSRFVKAAFTKLHSVSGESESESISQFFHILGSVEQQRGCVHLGGGKYEITIYSSCCNTDKGIYYYRTYENSQLSAVAMHQEDLESAELISYPLITGQQIRMQNEHGGNKTL